MKKTKVIFNTWSGAFFQKGGGEVQLLKTKEALEAKGLQISFFNQWNPDLDVDVFHQFSIQSGVEHVLRKYKDKGIPVALSPIMWFPPEPESWEYNRIKELMDLSDILMTNSDTESKLLAQHFNIRTDKFHKTRNSISESYMLKDHSKSFRENYKIHGDFVLSVGNVDTRKATHLLVEACKKLDLQLVVIGHVKDEAYFDSFKDTYSNYIHLGPIEDEETLKSAYQQCSLFALPSYCETPGIAALEAASQGAKVVITSEGSAKDYFGDRAIYASPWSMESIITAIKNGLEMDVEGLSEFVIQNFTWNKTAEEVLAGYDKIMGN